MKRIPTVAALVALVALCSACASTTTLRSYPHGAKVKNESGHVVGVTPYEHTDSEMANHSKSFVIEKEGFEPEYVSIKRDQPNALRIAGGLIGGLFVMPLWGTLLWSSDYKPEYSIQLSPLANAEEVADTDETEVEVARPAAPKKKAAKKSRYTRR